MDGILIVFDGIDGGGKTTQANLLADTLRAVGEPVVTSKEPTAGQYGQRLRDSARTGRMSLEEELSLFIADRREHVETVVRPALAEGSIVIIDRYYYSTAAYQGQRGGDLQSILDSMKFAPVPDVTFFIDLPPAVAAERILERGDVPNHFEGIEAQSQIRERFKAMAQLPEVVTLNGTMPIEAVYESAVATLLSGVLKSKRCAKSYDCEVFYCAARIAGECRWAEIYRGLKAVA